MFWNTEPCSFFYDWKLNMIPEPRLEWDDSPPDKWIAVAAPKRPEKQPTKLAQSNFLYWFIIICGIISFIEWYR